MSESASKTTEEVPKESDAVALLKRGKECLKQFKFDEALAFFGQARCAFTKCYVEETIKCGKMRLIAAKMLLDMVGLQRAGNLEGYKAAIIDGDECDEQFFLLRNFVKPMKQRRSSMASKQSLSSDVKSSHADDNQDNKKFDSCQDDKNKEIILAAGTSHGGNTELLSGDKIDNEEPQNKSRVEDTSVNLAWEMIMKARAIFLEHAHDQETNLKLAESYWLLGIIDLEKKMYTEAVNDLLSCLQLQKEHGERGMLIASTNFALGVAHRCINDFITAKGYFGSSLETAGNHEGDVLDEMGAENVEEDGANVEVDFAFPVNKENEGGRKD